MYRKHICENTQKLPQSRNTAFPRHQKMERLGTNKDNTNATYEATDAQIKKNCNRITALERSVGKLPRGGAETFLPARNLYLI